MHQLANFPCIVEIITASFTFTDILNCLRVSHAWRDVLAPVLYLDVVTFRSVIDNNIVWYNAPFTHFALHKYAHHIRAITCHGSDILIRLSNSECHLRDINYITDSDSPLRIQLDHLASLVSRNPGLLAISIEEARFHSAGDLQALLTFVQFLKDHPSITCFFLEIESDMNPNVCKALLKILERRLDLIKTDSARGKPTAYSTSS
ncbi:hypothetical protein CPB97_009522 [Podila verticillata]|nr:hypothetical protein CPB97_009522 [Podila verticillata]